MSTYYIAIFKRSLFLLLLVSGLSSCKKFADVDAPNNQLSSGSVFTNDATLKSAIAGMYSTLANANAVNLQVYLTAVTSFSAQDMTCPGATSYDDILHYSIPSTNPYTYLMWGAFYKTIYQANSIIEGIAGSQRGALTDSISNNAVAECKFLRAFCHFYLTNLWGAVPLVTTTNPTTNNTIARSAQDVVYNQIINDLQDARSVLRQDYTYSGGERVRVNRFAAMALLARVYLYRGEWKLAEAYADSVISKTSLYGLLKGSAMPTIFLKNNTEAIWQMSSTGTVDYTQEGNYYQTTNVGVPLYALTTNLVTSFEANDTRLVNWTKTIQANGVTYYLPYKYKRTAITTSLAAEYATMQRLGELYLIRAEARNNQQNTTGALSDLNEIRNRAGLSNSSAITTADITLAIEKERRSELFAEYGHRWMDLKRTGRADAVLGAASSEWSSSDALYPIPLSEITNNNNLTQNKDY